MNWWYMVFLLPLFACIGGLLWTLPGYPYKRFFARPVARELAAAITSTNAEDWQMDTYYAYSPSLDVTVWHANEGYGFKLWLGAGKNALGEPKSMPIVRGGADGEALNYAFKKVAERVTYEHVAKHLSGRVTQ